MILKEAMRRSLRRYRWRGWLKLPHRPFVVQLTPFVCKSFLLQIISFKLSFSNRVYLVRYRGVEKLEKLQLLNYKRSTQLGCGALFLWAIEPLLVSGVV